MEQVLNEKLLDAMIKRGLDPEVVTRMGTYSVRLSRGWPENEPSADGEVLCFPYIENGEEVNTKFRWRDAENGRRFLQRKGAVKTPFNVDVVLDAVSRDALVNGSAKLVWTEGEFDCIAAVQCGFEHSISLPDGAVAARDAQGRLLPPVPEDTRDIDPANDDKFSFFARHAEELMLVQTHVIATDDDEPGRRMAKELVRRIGAARCMMVTYPEAKVVPDAKAAPVNGLRPLRACKDINEVLQHLGADAVREMIDAAKPWPVRGLYKLSDYPDVEDPVTYDSGIAPLFDEHVRLYEGAFVVMTGIPGAGKSTLANQWVGEMARRHRLPVTIFSGEMPVKPYLSNPLMTGFLRKEKASWTREDGLIAEAFIERYFSFIDYSLRPDEDETDIDIDFILTKAADACFRYGTKILVIDPWNEIEHGGRPGNVTQSEHIGNSIRRFKRFGKTFGCAVIIVAHPTKMNAGETPGLYSIADSANFANKAEQAIVVHAPDILLPPREIIIPKIKFKGSGMKGHFPLAFDPVLELFGPAPVDHMANA